MIMQESLSLVFPMFNESCCLRQAIIAAQEAVEEITSDYEIIVVDDASTDGSGAVAEGLSRLDSHIKVVHNAKNRKLGGSLKGGFGLACKDFVLYSDMDMPFDFSEIKNALVLLLQENADLVCAYRLNREADGIKRYIYSIVYNSFIRVLFGLKVKDINFSFKLIKSGLLRELNLASEGSFINAEMLIKAIRRKAKVVQFGTTYFPRMSGSSHLSSISVIAKIIQEALAFRVGMLNNNRAQ